MSAKKSCALFISAAVLSVIAVCLIFGVLCVHERCITADEFSVEIEAIQFGDIPETVSYRVDKKYPEIKLSLSFTVYADENVICRNVSLMNGGGEPVYIRKLMSFIQIVCKYLKSFLLREWEPFQASLSIP